MIRFALALPVSLLALSSATAQRTWVVDAANGAGAHFTTVTAAVNAAADGDLIDVRPAHYAETFNIPKAITIRGTAPGVAIHPKNSGGYSPPRFITIHNLPRGKTVAFRGVKIAALNLFRVRGAVTLDNVQIEDPQSSAIFAEDCDMLAIRESQIAGTIRVAFVRLLLDRCSVVGDLESVTNLPPRPAGPAISTDRSVVSLVGTWLRGAKSKTFSPPGIRAKESRILARGTGSRIEAGPPTKGGGNAVAGDAKTILQHDRQTALVPNPGSAAILGPVQVSYREFPILSAQSPVSGTALPIEIRSKAGSTYVVLIGLPGPAVLLPSPEPWLLDARSAVVIAVGRQQTGTRKLSVQVPRLAGLERLNFLLQGAQLGAGGDELTNPVVLGLR